MPPHRFRRPARLLVPCVAAAALAAPAAHARPIDVPQNLNRSDPGMMAAADPAPAPPRAPVVQKIDDGFDWGSAAIGAGGSGALVVLISLGGFAIASRRRIGVAQ
jgi:hypothetical protein